MTPLFGEAGSKIIDKMTETFKAQATAEVRESIDPAFVEALSTHPARLVNQEVPSIRIGAGKDEKVRILDTQMARDWQEAVAGLVEADIDDLVKNKTQEVQSMVSVIQESVQMYQNNPDLIVGTKGFDRELAERFVRLAKSYEVKTPNGVIGYAVNVQPLINELRAQVTRERAQAPTTPSVNQALSDKASQQARDEAGRFDGPQPGISSKADMSGDGSRENYDAFWGATPFGKAPGLSI